MHRKFRRKAPQCHLLCQVFPSTAQVLRVATRWMCAAILSIAPAIAYALDGSRPEVRVFVNNQQLSISTVRPTSESRPRLFFGAVATFPQVSPAVVQTIDVYLGAWMPGGQIISWVPDSALGAENTRPVPGLVPLARNVASQSMFDTQSIVGGQFTSHRFSPSNPPGLYLIFCILVPAGMDPSNPIHWIRMGTEHLYVVPADAP